ncbi:DUF5672 family protein [Flavobacterium sp. XS2P39]|uniref:DUF5672 family protein n=1 Tax=Flavobacterium sp. XS2P39 TaxID=3401725 RepID=UPI003AAEF170
MNKKEICIVIPIYKKTLNSFEIQSVEQCIKVLSDYMIHFVCPKGLNVDFYKEKFIVIENFTYFDKHYFEDLSGYNRLMLNVHFYRTFDKYKYMLIYQTDCYVFRDELLDWSNKGYDYIGGVWFEGFVGNPYLGSKLWQTGNGGFSLRKIESIIRLLTSKKPIKPLKQLVLEKKKMYEKSKINFFKELFLLPLNVFGYKNNYNYKAEIHSLNEDIFFIEAYSKFNGLKIPNVYDAINFSWDRCPAFLYEKFGQLPFACHAWFREDFPYEGNRVFWTKHIKIK